MQKVGGEQPPSGELGFDYRQHFQESPKKEAALPTIVACTIAIEIEGGEGGVVVQHMEEQEEEKRKMRKKAWKGFDYFGFALQTAGDYICHGGRCYADDTRLDDLL
ncbi:hypothetical protein OUZ56_008646 [Daphnia magna]|uniref:Uncharacterized protein n=1 Tax=Daphnia magna TaxID=35525 RepID=A0ABR0ADM2_9CRUS|nr:hypothetical protein OUZ56_008646 [Daphnia magna]